MSERKSGAVTVVQAVLFVALFAYAFSACLKCSDKICPTGQEPACVAPVLSFGLDYACVCADDQ